MKKINEMTIQEKIGQLMCVGFIGTELTDDLKYLIDTYKVGNVILFTRNIKDIKQLFELNKQIHNYILEKTNIMPFISIDQEGGMVTRIMNGATFCPGNMTLATQDPSLTYEIGVIMGSELRALGINMNLAPSLDVNNNPNNPVIGVRSYSDNPDVVSKYGLNFIQGLQSQGVVATAKHFPGHGDTESDSHLSLPVIPHDKKRLNEIELKPFINCLKETQAIMSAHVFFKAYEEDSLPGTLSKKVITNLLREELGYEGLIVSDCMEMKAIADNYTTVGGCIKGLQAGLDQVMVSQTFKTQEQTCLAIYEAYKNNEITVEEIDSKVNRILKSKESSYNLMKEYFYNKEFSDVVSIIDNQKHKELAQKIVDNSLTLVKGENIKHNLKTLVITTEPFAATIAEDELSSRSVSSVIKEAKLDVSVKRIKVSIEDEEIDKIVADSKNYEQIIVVTFNANLYTRQAKLVNKLLEVNPDIFVLSTRSPYDINKFENVKNYLCLYEYTPASCQTILKYLQGKLTPSAVLPVSLYPTIGLGASVYVGLDDYSLNDNLNYIKKLDNFGIKHIFISLHMKEQKGSYLEDLEKIVSLCDKLGIKISLDVSSQVYKTNTIPKVYALRLDYGFTKEEIVKMYFENNFVIELNASTIKESDLIYFKNSKVNLSKVRISHNFYPKPYTGLDSSKVIEKNKIFHKYNMKVMIYIPSQNQKRPPIYNGLPTIEEHRNLNLYSILSSIKYLEADEVFFSDAYASDFELDLLRSFNFNEVIVPILIYSEISVLEKEILKRIHRNRTDASSYFIRSSIRVNEDITPFNTTVRNVFDVTIDNSLFKRYAGEVSIIKKELEKDNRVNVVGKALINDDVIKRIEMGVKFKFIIVGEI